MPYSYFEHGSAKVVGKVNQAILLPLPLPLEPFSTPFFRTRKYIHDLILTELSQYSAKQRDVAGVGPLKSKWQELGKLRPF